MIGLQRGLLVAAFGYIDELSPDLAPGGGSVEGLNPNPPRATCISWLFDAYFGLQDLVAGLESRGCLEQ